MPWTPRTTKQNHTGINSNPKFTHFGGCNEDGTNVLVYGPKEHEKAREPQSRRALNKCTFEMMFRGIIGIGELGVNSLAPLGNGRNIVDIMCFNDVECPHYDEFVSAVETVSAELEKEGVELPDWMTVVIG